MSGTRPDAEGGRRAPGAQRAEGGRLVAAVRGGWRAALGAFTLVTWVAAAAAVAAAAGPGAASEATPFGAAPPAPAASELDPRVLAERQLESNDAQELKRVLERLDRELGPQVPPLTWDDLRRYVRGEGWPLDARAWLTGLGRFFAGEVLRNFDLLGKLVILAVLAALLTQLRLGSPDSTVARVAEATVFLALSGLALSGFFGAVQLARGAVAELRDIMLAALPLLVSLLATSGAWASAGIFHPLLLFFVNGISLLASGVAFPLLFFGAVLDLVSIFAAPFTVTGLARLFRNAALGALALALTAFVGLVTVQGIAGTVTDGIGLRTAKYLASTFVPVLGKIFADAADVVASASLLLRSGAGLLALLMVMAAVAFPLLKLVSLIFAYRLGAALLQPLGGGPVVAALAAMGDALATLALVVGAVALMFFMAITAMIAAGTAAVMLR
ncbi:MAG: stage III sporulation protein AE [Firmicutes bacterium]|nr:stage III sporulation protein AE [Bacillota bacterium]